MDVISYVIERCRCSDFSSVASDLDYEFVNQPQDVVTMVGLPVTLSCRPPASYPAPNVTWYKDGVELVDDGRRVPMVMMSGDLYWTRIRFSDAGVYVCVVVNDFANMATRLSSPATVAVQGTKLSQIKWRLLVYVS